MPSCESCCHVTAQVLDELMQEVLNGITGTGLEVVDRDTLLWLHDLT